MNLNKIKFSIIVFTSIFLLLMACKPLTDAERIHNTMEEVLTAINQNDFKKVVSYIGADFVIQDTFSEKIDVEDMYYILAKYHQNKIDSLKWSTDNKIDELSRIKYVIPLFDGFDSLTGLEKASLNLYFGPPQMVSYDKLSGFEYEKEVNSVYRGKLLDQGKLLDHEDVLKTLKK